MTIGVSVFLIAFGAIVAFAITTDSVGFLNLNILGYILMAAGVIGLARRCGCASASACAY
jgi:hypothetical protein